MCSQKTSDRKFRNSSIELLRVLCMMLIILNHYSYYGDWEEFQYEIFSWSCSWIQLLHIGGTIAVDIFILITGYFSVGKIFDWKRIAKLLVEMYFYSIVIYVFFASFGIVPFSIKSLVKAFLPFLFGNWYCVYYILFCFFQPYINKLLSELDEGQSKKLVLILLLVWSVIPTFLREWTYGNLSTFIVIYIVGYYIRKYVTKEKELIFVGIISLGLLCMSILMLDFVSVFLKTDIFLKRVSMFDKNNSIFVVLSSISIFLIFKNIAYQNRLINYIGTSVIGVYLIHDNENVREFLWKTWWNGNEYFGTVFFIIHPFFKMIIIYLCCLLIDVTRRKVFDYKIDNRIETVAIKIHDLE